MENSSIREIIERSHGELEFSEYAGRLIVRVPRENIVEVCEFLRDHKELNFNYCADVTAIDHLLTGRVPRFDVVYQLYSVGYYHSIRLKVGVPESACTIDSVASVWPAAEKAECEIFDLYGISFNNHPDLYRIIMPEDWEGHPLRKDFPLGGSTSFYYKRDTHEYAGEPEGFVPRIRLQKGDV